MLVDIVIHGDILCPWCYLQKKSLGEAMGRYQALHPEVEFDVSWKPFLLYPTLRKGDKRALYEKTMSPEKLRSFTSRLQKGGARHGVSFSVTGSTGPSQPAHRLLALAFSTGGRSAQAAVLDALFQGHFEHGADITDEEWLVAVGRSAGGLEDGLVREALRSDEAGRMLEDEVRSAAVGGVEAVPCVTVQGRFRVGGYQEPDVFEGLFDKIRRQNR